MRKFKEIVAGFKNKPTKPDDLTYDNGEWEARYETRDECKHLFCNQKVKQSHTHDSGWCTGDCWCEDVTNVPMYV